MAVSDKPDSFLNIDRAETQFDDSVDTYADCVYQKAREIFDTMRQDGRFIQDDRPYYYIYEQTMDGRTQKGLVALASIDDYCNHVIKQHEKTRADKELDRIRHVDALDAQTGPIFLAYHSNASINDIVDRYSTRSPLYDFLSEDGIRHKVICIDQDKDIVAITEAFQGISSLYIADGHHRAASAVKVGLQRSEQYPEDQDAEYKHFLSVLFPDDQLQILDYNRVLKEFNGMCVDTLLSKLAEVFDVKKNSGDAPFRPTHKGQFGLYVDHQWYILDAKDSIKSTDAVDGLDVSILQQYVLAPLFGIEDPKVDQRIAFVGGIRGLHYLEQQVDAGCACAFSMYPTSMAELFAVADENRLMPPKSTWFEPKLRSGLFIHDITRS